MMKTKLALAGVLCVGAMMVGGTALAAAKLQVYPTSITIKSGENSGFVNVINGGSSIGRYRANFVDQDMPEMGPLKALPEGQKGPYSAQDFLRISPVSVTVPPGQSQKFRLLARMPRDLPDGEYMTHLSVLMSSSDVEADSKPQKGIGMKLSPRLRISMPVVLYKGETSFKAVIENMTFQPAQQDRAPLAIVTVASEGNRSARGVLTVSLVQGGKSYELYKGDVTVYRGNPRRTHRAGLDVPKGVSLTGVLKATYVGEDGELISEKSINL